MNFSYLVYLLTLLKCVLGSNPSVASDELSDDKNETHILSRRKRYLIFPDGSSLQFVFCLQLTAVIPIYPIFLFGDTVSLAWELPSDPKTFSFFKKNKNVAASRGDDINDIYKFDSNGRIAAKPRKKKFFHPTFAKRSVPDAKAIVALNNRPLNIDRNQMHEKLRKRDFLNKKHMNEDSIRFHRASRVGLFEKLELLFKTLGWNGRQCVLKKLCESGQRNAPQGSFFHELLRIIFTFPKSELSDAEIREEYDSAHASKEECFVRYPDCPEFDVPTNIFAVNNFSEN